MARFWRVIAAGLVLFGGMRMSRGVELTVSRDALERTLKQQLYSGPDGRYYLKGNAHTACFISTEDPELRFEQDRIVVRVKTRARLGVGGACLGMTVTLPAEVSDGHVFRSVNRADRVTGEQLGERFDVARVELRARDAPPSKRCSGTPFALPAMSHRAMSIPDSAKLTGPCRPMA